MTTKWDKRFLKLAEHVGNWSKDPGAKVGAVIADSSKRVVSLGYNGPPRGTHDIEMTREVKLMRTIHAEENALLFARQDLTGMTLYCNYPPCATCMAKIIQSGITGVITKLPDVGFMERWADSMEQAAKMAREAGVSITVTGEI